MPQKDMSSKIGSSPSKVMQRVIDNNKNVQKPLPVATATKQAYNKEPVKVG